MRDTPPRPVLRFGQFRLDPARAALLDADGAPVPLRPRSLDVLAHLVRNAGRVVSREELLEAIWRGVFVTDDSVTQCIAEVRRALGPEAESMLRTVPRRGYLFEAPVTAVAPEAPPAPRPPLPLPDGPSLAVLPFASIGNAPDYLAAGFAEEVITALAHLPGLFVIARESSFAFAGQEADARQAGRDLGVRYVLLGSVRCEGERVRFAGRLVEAETGRQIWADRFDGERQQILVLQDRVAEAVAGAVEPSLLGAELARSLAKPTESQDAYDLYLQALAQANTNTPAGLDAAIALIRRALQRDPGYALVKALGAWCCIRRLNERRAQPEEHEEARAWSRGAVAEAQDDARVQAWAGHGLAHFALDLDQARGCTDRAVALCPGSAPVLTQSAWVLTFCGEAEAAIARFRAVKRLNPLGEVDSASGLGMAQLMAGQYEAALDSALVGVRDARRNSTAFRVATVALVRLGRMEEARGMAARLLQVVPGFTIRRGAYMPHFRAPEFVADYVEALLAAGVPEGAG